MFGLPVWAGVLVLVGAILTVELAIWRLLIIPRMRARLADAAREAEAALGGEVIRSGRVSFAGTASRGPGRGTGYLAVGPHEVVFVHLSPRSMLRIARARIDSVETTPRDVGGKRRRPLLRIAFRDEAGEPDAVGFHVGRDTRPWEEALAAG